MTVQCQQNLFEGHDFLLRKLRSNLEKLIWFATVLVALLDAICLGEFDSNDEGFFRDRVQPILAAKCLSCHGPKIQKSSYRLDIRDIALSGGDHGEPPIVPGKIAASLLLNYVSDEYSAMAMPPLESQQPRLTLEEVASLREWVENGAIWPDSANGLVEDPLDWWSFKPLRKMPPLSSDSHPIDTFIKLKLAERGLTLSAPTDARTLCRRLFFDLIGLPPTPEELDAFVYDSGTDAESALDRLVEKLLAMPEYGERWARHWLDVVHYGDTHGYDKDKPRPNAWPYRDYVIRALNEDKPYSRFIEEQIAGDVLWPHSRDGIEALGFIAAGPWDFIGHAEVSESKIDGKIARHLDRDDMVSNTIGSFCSVTIHCAQCHQHKFDPISQEDYYRLHAVFSALDRTDREYHRDEAIQKKFLELERMKNDAAIALKQIDFPLIKLAGDEYVALTKRIEGASKSTEKNVNKGTEFGYHSEIAFNQDTEKWVQVDLGKPTELNRVTLRPCYDDFNSIGAGFGFPQRFKIEACDDPEFKSGVMLFRQKHDETFHSDFKNPGLQPFSTIVGKEAAITGRYVRVTASNLALRQVDFILALAEMEVYDRSDNNLALGCKVEALDTTEAAPRWRKSNLTDGVFPAISSLEDKTSLTREREALLVRFADEATVASRQKLLTETEQSAAELKKLPAPNLVYAGGIHSGSGTFVGTGASGGKPRRIHLLARGQVTQPLGEMSPGALSSLPFRPFEFVVGPNSVEGDRRVALAHWVSDPSNPLTWRSIVNRVWLYHFGRGFVDTPNDIGHNGGLPTHPVLLDWLAADFRDNGGSLKRLHRLIVKSETYRQSSSNNDDGARLDSNNTLLWRQNRRRLEAEAIRDSVLAVSGTLDKSMGGPGWKDFVVEFPDHSPHYEYSLADPEDATTWRRSVYRFIVRSQTQPWMTSLDCADPSMRVDKRNESLSSIQALALLNNGFILTQAKHFADRVSKQSNDIEVQVDLAYQLAFGEAPVEGQRAQLIAFAKLHGMPYLCRAFFNLNAFSFVD